MVSLNLMWFKSRFLSSNKAESKNSRQQNKTLSATVLKLTKAVKQLEDENQELKQEMTREEIIMMDSPVCRAKGTYIYNSHHSQT